MRRQLPRAVVYTLVITLAAPAASFAAGPGDAEGDFAAVGDEDFLDHG